MLEAWKGELTHAVRSLFRARTFTAVAAEQEREETHEREKADVHAKREGARRGVRGGSSAVVAVLLRERVGG